MTPLTIPELVGIIPAFCVGAFVLGYIASYTLYIVRKVIWMST